MQKNHVMPISLLTVTFLGIIGYLVGKYVYTEKIPVWRSIGIVRTFEADAKAAIVNELPKHEYTTAIELGKAIRDEFPADIIFPSNHTHIYKYNQEKTRLQQMIALELEKATGVSFGLDWERWDDYRKAQSQRLKGEQ